MAEAFPPLRYLNVPNAMTSAAIALTVAGLVLLVEGQVQLAATLYFGALGLDFLDGIVARRLGQQTEIGLQLDSLADLLNFCAAPALVGWMAGMRAPWQVAILALYVLAGAWRLAFYNVHGLEDQGARAVFRGLPTTFAAAWFLALGCLLEVLELPPQGPLLAFLFVSAVLMVSGIPVPKRGAFIGLTIGAAAAAVGATWLS